jgi:four helix bundle protein
MRDFKNLKVWEEAHQLSLKACKISSKFPDNENFGLTSQIRRAAVFAELNSAEGCGRNSESVLKRSATIGMGSAAELVNIILLVSELGYFTEEEYKVILDSVIEEKNVSFTYCIFKERKQ